MMNILIADDEQHACHRLSDIIREIPGCRVAGYAATGFEVVRKADELDVDLVLMDIHMPVMDGLEAARCIRDSLRPPQIIFTTAYRQHALAAFEMNVVGYLLKPVMRRKLSEKIEALQRTQIRGTREPRPGLEPGRSHIYCRAGNRLQLVAIRNVIFFRAENKYTLVYHTRGYELVEDSLKQLEQEFGDRLLRIHRNTMVNKEHIKSLERDAEGRYRLVMNDLRQSLLVSRRYVPKIRLYMKEFHKLSSYGD